MHKVAIPPLKKIYIYELTHVSMAADKSSLILFSFDT